MLLEDIDACRTEIERIKREIHDCESMRIPAEEAVKRVMTGVDAMRFGFEEAARRAALQIAEPDAAPAGVVKRFLAQTLTLHIPQGRTVVGAEVDLGGLLCWLHGDAIKAALVAEVKRAGYVAGVKLADRPARLVELRRELRELEITEEGLIEAAEAAGFEVYRRADVDPEIVLGLQPEGDLGGSIAAAAKKSWAPPRLAAESSQPAAPAPASFTLGDLA